MQINLKSFADDMNQQMDSIDKNIKVAPIQDSTDMKSYIDQCMVAAETVAFCYNERQDRAEIYTNKNGVKTTEYFDMDGEEYKAIVSEYCDDINDEFNHSNWYQNSFGDLIRVFTMLPPVCKFPNVTINISRAVKDYSLSELPENVRQMIPFIVSNRFIVVGQTGSGKTYFLNRALKNTFSGQYDEGAKWNFNNQKTETIRSGVPGGGVAQIAMNSNSVNGVTIPKNVSQNRIALVEEFHEIFEPNKNTICMSSCPVKPGNPNMFAYIVQQTNLMRLDHVFVGEIKGEESFYFINNLSSGIRGGATCHGSNAVDGLMRLRILMSLSGFCSIDLAGQLIANALDFVIYIDKHKIKEIKRVTGVYNVQSQKFQVEDLYIG